MSQIGPLHASRGYQAAKDAKGITMKEILIVGAGYTGMGATMGLAAA
jgi:hypothetical protein